MPDREELEDFILAHEVDMSGYVSGGPWDPHGGRCRTCGELDPDEFPAAHLARMLTDEEWFVDVPANPTFDRQPSCVRRFRLVYED